MNLEFNGGGQAGDNDLGSHQGIHGVFSHKIG